jgi:NTP pyrophosphatase (non-canonical NTP hydrolase)
MKLALSSLTLAAIQAEATAAHAKHGEHSMLSQKHSSGERLAILVEEVGEVAHELTYDQGGPGVGEGRRDELVKELIQVAAMAASWVEYLEGGYTSEVPGVFHPAQTAMMETIRAAVDAHGTTGGIQWYVDEFSIDCDAEEFWGVVFTAISAAMPGAQNQ